MPEPLAGVAPELAAGLACYLSDDYWHAHEHWERAWRRLAPPEAGWVQALILVAAAAHHLRHSRHAPARRLLSRALPRLRTAPEVLGPIRLPADAGALVSSALDRDHLAVPPLHLVGAG